MELLQLRYFCTVARLENISRGAAYHRIPQPAMSKTISKLERELGVQLFERKKNQILLTPQGQAFYGRVAMALQELDGALDELKAEHIPDQVRFSLLVTALRGKTAEFLALFRRRYPNVTFQVTSSPAEHPLPGQYDLCITDEPPTAEYDCSFPLLTRQVEAYAAVGKSHPFAQKKELSLDDLKDVPMVAISGSPLVSSLAKQCRNRGFTPNVVISCDDLQCLQRYIRSGIGIAFTASYSWPDMTDPQIRFVKLNTRLSQQISAYWCSAAPRSKAWFALAEQLQQFFNPTAPYWDDALDKENP